MYAKKIKLCAHKNVVLLFLISEGTCYNETWREDNERTAEREKQDGSERQIQWRQDNKERKWEIIKSRSDGKKERKEGLIDKIRNSVEDR